MNDRVLSATRALATERGEIRERVATAALILSYIRPGELDDFELECWNKILTAAQRYPAQRDANGNVIRSAFEETARHGDQETAEEVAMEIWELYQRLF